MAELLKELTEAPGVSGNEDRVREIILGAVRPWADKVWVDRIGNVIAEKDGTPDGGHVMLCAHMDEVGFLITHITDNGMLKFKPVGSMDPRVWVAKRVLIGAKGILGVLGIKAIHLQEPDERSLAVKAKQMYIDIGVKNREEAEKLVQIGDYAAFDSGYVPFGAGRVKGKALDDRVGCAVLIEVLKGSYPAAVTACFTVQEEVGLRGAQVAAYHVQPDLALVIEGTTCADVPGSEPHQHTTRMGAGPALSFMDHDTIAHRGLFDQVRRTAEASGIPLQIKENVSGGNDAGRIHVSRGGIPTAVLSVPCRYIHSPSSVLDLKDYQNTIALVEAFLRGCGQ